MSFTLETRFERGLLLKLICDLVAHTVHKGVLITFMSYTWTANLHQNTKEAKGVWGNFTEEVYLQFYLVNYTSFVYFLTVNWEPVESAAIDSPRCLTGIGLSPRIISVTIAFDKYYSLKIHKAFEMFPFYISYFFLFSMLCFIVKY